MDNTNHVGLQRSSSHAKDEYVLYYARPHYIYMYLYPAAHTSIFWLLTSTHVRNFTSYHDLMVVNVPDLTMASGPNGNLRRTSQFVDSRVTFG